MPLTDSIELFYQQGENCYYGYDVEKNYSEAYKCYEKAAMSRHTDAQYALGFMNELGQGIEKNYILRHA